MKNETLNIKKTGNDERCFNQLDTIVMQPAWGGVTPYYKDNYTAIYNIDSIEMLNRKPIFSVNAIITDPPYCSGAHESAKRTKRAGKTPESIKERNMIECDSMGTLGFEWTTRRWLIGGRRYVEKNGHIAVFTDWRMLPPLSTLIEAAGWRWNNVVVWNKKYAGLGAGFRAQHEMIILASNDAPKYFSYDYGNVLESMRLTKTVHPHQKPLDIIGRLIETCVGDGGIILDPFMGSGGTLCAARKLQRVGIGFELSEKYCEIAANRLKQTDLEF